MSYCAPAATLAALAARAFARFATSAAFRAGDSFLFGKAFFTAAFFACFAAWNAAHRFLVAATIAFLPAAESFRLGFGGSGVALDVGAECFTAGFVAVVPEDACKLTDSFARVTAAFAS